MSGNPTELRRGSVASKFRTESGPPFRFISLLQSLSVLIDQFLRGTNVRTLLASLRIVGVNLLFVRVELILGIGNSLLVRVHRLLGRGYIVDLFLRGGKVSLKGRELLLIRCKLSRLIKRKGGPLSVRNLEATLPRLSSVGFPLIRRSSSLGARCGQKAKSLAFCRQLRILSKPLQTHKPIRLGENFLG